MHIKKLTISGFKSYKNTVVELSPQTSIIGAWRSCWRGLLLRSPAGAPRPLAGLARTGRPPSRLASPRARAPPPSAPSPRCSGPQRLWQVKFL